MACHSKVIDMQNEAKWPTNATMTHQYKWPPNNFYVNPMKLTYGLEDCIVS